MKHNILVLLLLMLVSSEFYAQLDDSEILFTVDDKEISVEEFSRVYKKNIDLVKDESQKDIDAYLDLYINYHLKLKEAKRLGLDKDASYQREFISYKKQLTKNYMSDTKVTEELVKEAYERMSYDLKAVHILIRMDESVQDTIAAYRQLVGLRDRLKNENFETLKSELHDGAETYVEDLGYFTGFKMVYPFETVAFNTNEGSVSMPFRTRFGYHIVKVLDKRPSRGEVKVAHIMVAKNDKDSLVDPKSRIYEIYKKIDQGEGFADLARQFSDDKSSAKNGGELAPFQGGQLSSTEFEDVAFGLNEPNEISEPFETSFGWHIVKLIEKRGLQSYEEMRPELEVKVKRDSRSNLINSALVKNLKAQYDITINEAQVNYFKTIDSEDFLNGKWTKPDNFNSSKTILTIDGTDLINEDFFGYLQNTKNNYAGKNVDTELIVKKEIVNFVDDNLITYHENNLENINEDFAFILKEYRDGLLLFDLMEKEIWNAAVKDSSGLAEFYDANKSNYQWPERFKGTIVTSANKKALSGVVKSLKKDKTIRDIKKEIMNGSEKDYILTQGTFDSTHPLVPNNFKYIEGISEAYMMNGSYSVMVVDEVLAAAAKSLDEAKGKVISDYQSQLEEEWLKDLRKRYKVSVNDDVLTRVKIKLLE